MSALGIATNDRADAPQSRPVDVRSKFLACHLVYSIATCMLDIGAVLNRNRAFFAADLTDIRRRNTENPGHLCL